VALHPKIERFLGEYLIDLSAPRAAEVAGVAVGTAYAWLRDPRVQQRLSELQAASVRRVGLEADRILLELVRLAMVDPIHAFDKQGNLRPLDQIPEDVRRAISGIEVEEKTRGKGEDAEPYRVKKVKFWSKEKALELLGKHKKLFTDKVEVDGQVSVKVSISGIRKPEDTVLD